eukprot:TRINITY_DN9072_c1_g1_i4.p2 TRINITY_DN9072_c1_g1~~TRINITY_DN9072_c1_g1_i4.p2  ORF type:complete len:242 (-),score=-4.01 TRINITY_DN9072_c1_g1_i4:217-942(-)
MQIVRYDLEGDNGFFQQNINKSDFLIENFIVLLYRHGRDGKVEFVYQFYLHSIIYLLKGIVFLESKQVGFNNNFIILLYRYYRDREVEFVLICFNYNLNSIFILLNGNVCCFYCLTKTTTHISKLNCIILSDMIHIEKYYLLTNFNYILNSIIINRCFLKMFIEIQKQYLLTNSNYNLNSIIFRHFFRCLLKYRSNNYQLSQQQFEQNYQSFELQDVCFFGRKQTNKLFFQYKLYYFVTQI